MKKNYIAPSLKVVCTTCSLMLSGSSVNGVEGTGSFITTLNDGDVTDEYLSRRGSFWDDEE